MKRKVFLLAVFASLLIVTGLFSQTGQTGFFDVPTELLPDSIPSSSAQLSQVSGYPNDPDRLTLIA
jgi:hypothetical protein